MWLDWGIFRSNAGCPSLNKSQIPTENARRLHDQGTPYDPTTAEYHSLLSTKDSPGLILDLVSFAAVPWFQCFTSLWGTVPPMITPGPPGFTMLIQHVTHSRTLACRHSLESAMTLLVRRSMGPINAGNFCSCWTSDDDFGSTEHGQPTFGGSARASATWCRNSLVQMPTNFSNHLEGSEI